MLSNIARLTEQVICLFNYYAPGLRPGLRIVHSSPALDKVAVVLIEVACLASKKETPEMSQKPPLLQQVDVKNGVPGAAAINQPGPAARGSNGASSAPHNDGPAAVAGAPAAATPEIYEMLAELRRDIDARRNVEAAAQHAAPAGELHAMMSDLRRDMSVLKRSPVTIRTAGTARPIGADNAALLGS